MRKPPLTRRMILAGVALAVLVGIFGGGSEAWAQVASPNPCISGQPCFTDVSDILFGRRHLLRTDDLSVAYQAGSEALGNLLLTDASNITSNTASSLNGQSGGSTPTVVAARMFNTPYDVAVSAVLSGTTFVWSLDARPNDGSPVQLSGTVDLSALFATVPSSVRLYSAAADFTGDGLDEVLFVLGVPAPLGEMDGGWALFATAVDPTNPQKGLNLVVPANLDANALNVVFGPVPIALDTSVASPRIYQATNGVTFNACGNHQGGLGINYSSVDPQTFTLTNTQYLQVSIPEGEACVQAAAIAVGRFGNTLHNQLAMAYAVQGGTVKVIPFDLDAQGNPVQKPLFDTGLAVGAGSAWMRSGQFDWGDTFDQAALLISSGQENSLRILTFDSNLNVQSGPVQTIAASTCVGDLAVGNFDRMQTNPAPPPATIRNPNPQLATFLQPQCGGGNFAVQIWDVTSVSGSSGQFQVGPTNTVYNFSSPAGGSVPPQSMAMAAVDLQGRSLRLGTPTKVVINRRSQPSVVLATPPMHVDYIVPANKTAAQVLNVSAIPIADLGSPIGFFSKYQKEQGSQVTSSTMTSTSWSFGVGETLEGNLTIGDPDVAAISVEDKFSAQQQWKGSVQNANESVTSSGFDVSIATSFGDAIWYDESRLNLYIYPVIGKQVCPATNTSCSVMEPMTVQFSGVDSYSSNAAAGNTTEWYQPVWEPGNVLSYPGDLEQLMALEPDLDQVSDTSNFSWSTDSIPVTENTYWKNQGQASTSTSFDQNYSFKNTYSVSYNENVGVESASVKGTLKLSGSVAFSRLHTGVTTLQQSTGIQINKPGTFADPPNYRYKVTPFIFGHQRPDPVLNTLPLDTPIQTFGILQTAYVVDPLDNAGSWWSQAYTQAPDVALNQPTRWTVGLAQTNPNDGTCLFISAGTSDVDCAVRSPSNPTDPWTDDFHTLRGFFISGAEAPGQGPQLETATAGDQLQLQVRVYNYSLIAMPANTAVHARFYGQLWNNTNNTAIGESFQIGEATQGAIPPFNTDSQIPNWQLLGTTFNTSAFDQTKNGNVYLTYWVVVWMEDGSGKLVGEIPGHGLCPTCLPGTLTSFADAVALEELASDGVSYSNNVGFYKYAFYLFPPPGTVTTPPPATPGQPPVRLGKVRVSAHHVERNERVLVSTTLRTADQPIKGGLTILFYDGTPTAGLPAFDVERVVHLRADDTYDVRVPFQSSTCGVHKIVVVAGRGTAFEQTSQVDVYVKCPRQHFPGGTRHESW